MSSRSSERRISAFLDRMWIEVMRIALLALGGGLAIFLAIAPRLACRFYAQAVVEGRDGAAGFWAFLAAGRGHPPRP